jgi:3-deoxy-D-manno-octulosonic-acid transferase
VDVASPQVTPEERRTLAEELGLDLAEPVLVAGSTGPGEEEILLDAFQRIRETLPHARLLLVPRQVQRARDIVELVRQRGFPVVRRTELPARNIYSAYERAVIVVDTTGELSRLYALATVAFVGRSLVPMGGSNLLEAVAYGYPVLIGPHMENFAGVTELALDHRLAFVVRNAQDIARQFLHWACNEQAKKEIARRARAFLEAQKGAARRTAEQLAQLLDETQA